MKNPVILNAYHYSAHDAVVRDRFIMMMVVAACVHAVLILGLAFEWHSDPNRGKRFDVTFINTQTVKAPENAKRFAEANQKGGGQSATEQLPQTISETKTPVNEFQVSEELVTSRLQATSPQVEQKRVLTSENQHVTLDVATEPKKGDARKLTAAQLYARSMEIASIDVPLSEKVVEESLGPEKRLAAEAAHHVEAAYRNTWRRKVEQVGKFNFPDLARRLGNSVTLELDVLINSDGTVRDIQILRSSGYQLLDTSAKRIVRLGAPYAPFPEAIQKYTDVLHITYQWRFIPGKGAIGG